AVVAGQRIHVIVCGFQPGVVVRFTFNGLVVSTVTATDTPARSCSQGDVALPARPASHSGGGVLAAIVPLHLLPGHVRAQTARPYRYRDPQATGARHLVDRTWMDGPAPDQAGTPSLTLRAARWGDLECFLSGTHR